MVAVHALTGAAHEIFHELLNDAGNPKVLGENPFVAPKRRRQYRETVKRARNFLKHADRKPDGILEFTPVLTEYYLCDAAWMFERLNGSPGKEGAVFTTWFQGRHPDTLHKEMFGEFYYALNRARKNVDHNVRKQNFLKLLDNRTLWRNEKGGSDGTQSE